MLAAYRSGIRTVILPKRNEADLMEDLPKELHEEMHFVFTTDIREVLDTGLEPAPSKEAKIKEEKSDENGTERSRRRKSEKAVVKV